MQITSNLCVLALRGVVVGASRMIGNQVGEAAVEATVGYLTRHFTDHSQRLLGALSEANDRAWRALEVALAGDSIWDRCKLVLASGDDKAFRDQVKPFLDGCSLSELQGRDTFRQACLNELRSARKAGVLTEGKLEPHALAQRAGAFARFNEPQAVLDAEHQSLVQMGDDLRAAGYANLAAFVELRPRNGDPILTAAARFFFRRAVETDTALFQGLAFARLEQIHEATDAGFAALERTLAEQNERLLLVLGEMQVAVVQTRDAVLDIRAEQARQGAIAGDIYSAVIDLQHKLDMVNREVRPSDSLSIRNDHERALVKQLVSRYRALPDDRRHQAPALLNAIGKLEVAAGDFESASNDFRAVATLAADDKAKAEAHANAYRAALEARDWDAAMNELREAVRLDPARFSPFPTDKLKPQKILGAGGFGVAFLCEHRFSRAPVVVKTLSDDDLDRGIDAVFAEAQALTQLNHDSVIRLQDCGFASPDGEKRPYLVMDYFQGQTLEDVAREKPLAVEDAVAVARKIAQGLKAAHAQSILHRDVKPANVLVRRNDDAWQVKLIDFGLALRRGDRETMLASSKTLMGTSIAGTLDYAAPEQMGKLTGTPVGPRSDVYGFGRTMCYALFGTPQPLMRHWRALPQPLSELLESCLEEDPKQRPADLASVLAVLDKIAGVEERPPAAVTIKGPPPQSAADEPARRKELSLLTREVTACVKCPNIVPTRGRVVAGSGPLSADIFLIGEAPGQDEDRTGQPFVGASGQLLFTMLAEIGMPPERLFVTNALKCRPPGQRKGEQSEYKNCVDHLKREVEVIKPRVIVCLGAVAAQNLLATSASLSSLRGKVWDYNGTPVVATYHPAYLMRNPSETNRRAVIEDLKLAAKHANR